MTEATAAEIRIRELARQHGIVAERTATDDWADQVARLSGDEPVADEVMDLVVTLQRRGVLSDQEAARLFGEHVLEQHNQEPRDTRTVREKLAKTLELSEKHGPYSPGDHKRETDEMWGEESEG